MQTNQSSLWLLCACVRSFCAAFFLSPPFLISNNNRQLEPSDPRPPVEYTQGPSFCRLLALEINELRACVCVSMQRRRDKNSIDSHTHCVCA